MTIYPHPAGLVRRWHANPDLAHIEDTVADHGKRVSDLIRGFWPDASEVLRLWALVHDFGEVATGDIPWPVKARMPPEVRAWFEAQEAAALADMFPDWPNLTVLEARRLHFCDRLDAYRFARQHAPHVMGRDDWPECREWLQDEAAQLGADDADAWLQLGV